jgi:hypothetical protein
LVPVSNIEYPTIEAEVDCGFDDPYIGLVIMFMEGAYFYWSGPVARKRGSKVQIPLGNCYAWMSGESPVWTDIQGIGLY